MNILTFLYSLILMYWSDALLVIATVIILAILYKRGKKDLVKRIINTLVVKAEKELGSSMGTAQYNLVISALYLQLPLILRLLFSKAELNTYIQDSVTWLKKQLEDPSVTLLSYADEALVKATESAPSALTERLQQPEAEIIVAAPIIKYFDANGIELTQVIAPIVDNTITDTTTSNIDKVVPEETAASIV